jgi:osmotically inducible protein OsmC
METTRQAHATWHGTLNEGSGTVRSGTSGAFPELGVTWKARTEESGGLTSPEELLASAHAACFSMAFSNQLAKAGFTADRVETTATVLFQKQDAGWTVAKSTLDVRAKAPGIADAQFQELANAAKDGCPISRALKGNVELAVNATLEG